MISVLGGAGFTRADVDKGDFLAATPAVDDATEEDGMHFSRVVAPGDDGIADIEVVVAAGGFIDAERADEPGDCGCHAEAGVGINIVVGKSALDELLSGVTFRNGPLTGAVDCESLGAFENAFGDGVDCFFPCDFDELAVAT